MTATARFIDGRRQPTRDQGRILLVTDDPRVGDCGAGLEERGFCVAGVAGGVKALVALQRTRPHVVVADAAVRGVSAGELARMLSDAQEPVPVILAGFDPATPQRRGEAMSAGASDYFQLPEEFQLLAALTRERVTKLFLAGGLNPDNAAAAVAAVRPYAVDVCSGVETSPGHKSPELMRRFVRAVDSSK